MKSIGIESLESRLLFSHAPVDAGNTADTATDIGSFAKNRSVNLKQSIGDEDIYDVFKFEITGTKNKIITLKLSQPKDSDVQYDLTDGDGGDFGTVKKYVLAPGTYLINVTPGSQISNYSLNVHSSNTTRRSPVPMQPIPAQLALGGLQTANTMGLQYTAGIMVTNGASLVTAGATPLNLGTGVGTTVLQNTAVGTVANGTSLVTAAANPLNIGTGVLTLANSNNTGSPADPYFGVPIQGGLSFTAENTVSVATGPAVSASSGTLSINTNNTTGSGSTLALTGGSTILETAPATISSGTLHLMGGTLYVLSQPTSPGATALDFSTLSIPAGAKIVIQHPTDDELATIKSNPNLQLTQNDDGSCTVTAAAPTDNTTTQVASDSGDTGTSDSSNSSPDTSSSANA